MLNKYEWPAELSLNSCDRPPTLQPPVFAKPFSNFQDYINVAGFNIILTKAVTVKDHSGAGFKFSVDFALSGRFIKFFH